jgi:CPA2 family monovalent cation:H+ antiporter-2
MGIAGDIALILVVCFFCALVAQRLGFPLLLGYIVAGVLVSPNTFGPSVGDVHEIELLADIGVALLLFTIGLEFPAEKLQPVRNVALLGTPLQMIAVSGYGFLLGRLVGWDWQQSVWFGALISISSTMVVLKILMSRGLMDTLSSKVMLAILVVQDLAVIPLMILLPAMGNLSEGLGVLAAALVRAVVFVAVMGLVGTRVLPSLLARAVSWKSRELFIVAVIGIGLGVGYATYLVGLSFAFGAFLAGLVLSRSDYSHDALMDMIPLREVFSLLFFAGVGLILSPMFVWDHLKVVIFLVVAVLAGKGFLMGAITRAFGYTRIIPLAVALSMAQVGEFAFVLARLGKESGSLQDEVYYIVVSVAVMTMAMTPFSSGPSQRIYQWWNKGKTAPPAPDEKLVSAADRLVLIGYNKLGRFVAGLLTHFGHKPLVVDSDSEHIRMAQEAGLETLLAEPDSPEVLKKLQMDQAVAVVLAETDRYLSHSITESIRELGEVHIVAVAQSMEHLDELSKLRVQDTILAPLETGLEMVHQVLLELDYEVAEAHALVDGIRHNHYENHAPEKIDHAESSIRLEWLEMTRDLEVPLDRRQVRLKTGGSVVAIKSTDSLNCDLEGPVPVRKGDRLALVGNQTQRANLRRWLAAPTDLSPGQSQTQTQTTETPTEG